MKNNILIKHPRNWGLQSRLVEELAKRALKEAGFEEGVELSLIFVGRKKARDLNMKYRQKDYIPQVLGFPMSVERDADGWTRLGDVVICTQKLKYEAVYQNKSQEMILFEWLKHGVENLKKG